MWRISDIWILKEASFKNLPTVCFHIYILEKAQLEEQKEQLPGTRGVGRVDSKGAA
jgi:hypothetical protein